MKWFIAGFDDQGQPLSMTYEALRAHADKWVITAATPEGPASLLKTAGDMFALGFYSYELVACSNAWSLFAVEAALKQRLGTSRPNFVELVKRAAAQKLVREDLLELLDTARQLRNSFVHQGTQAAWTLGMAASVIGASFAVVAELYPDPVGAPDTSR